MRDIFLVTGVLFASLFALSRPVFGLLAYVCVSLLSPHSMTWGFARTFPVAQCIAIGTLLGYLFWTEPRKFPLRREFFLLLALWILFGFTTLFALRVSDAWIELLKVSKVLLVVILSTSLINTRHRLHLLLRVIALSLGFHALKGGIFAILSGGNYMVWGPEGTFLEANNTIGLALAMNVPILFHLSKIETDQRLRWLLRSMCIFSYPAVLCTFSRGAWLGLAAASCLIALKSKHRLVAIVAAIFLIPSIAPFLPNRVNDRYSELKNYEEEASAQSRFWNWEFCTRVGLANPMLGAGFDYYSLEAYERFFPEFMQHWPGKVWSCHNTWLTIFGEHGLVGFGLWISLLTCSLFSLATIRSRTRHSQESFFWQQLTDLLLGSLVVYMVSGTFLDMAYFDLYYQLVAIILVAKDFVYKLPDNLASPRFDDCGAVARLERPVMAG
jgi:putative inorganic carbon (HCO3(-)) transporter